MILLEGPDGSGKSTIGRKLSGATGWPLVHSGGPPGSEDEARARIHSQLSLKGTILDRSVCTSELIYGPIVRGSMVIDPNELWIGINSMINRGWIMVYCRPSLDILEEYAKSKMEELIKEEGKSWKTPEHVEAVKNNIAWITRAYDELIPELRSRGMTILIHPSREPIERYFL